jgi:hypothetical protein
MRLIPPDARYLLKAVQGFQSQGVPIYAISTQVRVVYRSVLRV